MNTELRSGECYQDPATGEFWVWMQKEWVSGHKGMIITMNKARADFETIARELLAQLNQRTATVYAMQARGEIDEYEYRRLSRAAYIEYEEKKAHEWALAVLKGAE